MKTETTNDPGARIVRPFQDHFYREEYLSEFISLLKPKTANVPDELVGELPRWRTWTPVLIHAGTGTGKTTFVVNVLCPFAKEQGKSVLIVCNRLALKAQYLRQLVQQLIPDLEKEVSQINIPDGSTIGHVTVATYQGLNNLIASEKRHFDYVVLDEAHYFGADSSFSKDTGALLKKVTEVFKKSIRVYMTATPWLVQNLIAQAEEQVSPPLLKRVLDYQNAYDTHMMMYSMGLSYQWSTSSLAEEPHELKLYSFPIKPRNYHLHWLPAKVRDNLAGEELTSLCREIPDGEKIVIFVDSKEQGQQLADKLKTAAYLDRDRKSGKTWKQLVGSSQFQEPVLITTSVADCGLDIDDRAVRHVVLLSTNRTQFEQELGRVRRKDGELLNVYVPALSRTQLNRLYSTNENRYRWIKEFECLSPERMPGQRFMEWWCNDSVIRHLIPIDGRGWLHVNECAKAWVVQYKSFCEKLIEMGESGEKEPFLRMVCQWLGQPDLSVEDHWCYNDEEACRRQLVEFLRSYVGRELTTKEDQNKFASEMKKLRYQAYGPRKEDNASRPWGASIIQKDLKALCLPFQLKSGKIGSMTGWTLIEADSSADGGPEIEEEPA